MTDLSKSLYAKDRRKAEQAAKESLILATESPRRGTLIAYMIASSILDDLTIAEGRMRSAVANL
jgi:hypothetical protein